MTECPDCGWKNGFDVVLMPHGEEGPCKLHCWNCDHYWWDLPEVIK